tara:strand:- start:712 stop:963 length:252 start_codon:yes stop_codon:yes gene_type:complete
MENNWTKTTTSDKSIGMMSLYDYLGHAAGPDLGKSVASSAAKQKIKMETRTVANKKYTGPVMLYPKYFLDSYFVKKEETKLPF